MNQKFLSLFAASALLFVGAVTASEETPSDWRSAAWNTATSAWSTAASTAMTATSTDIAPLREQLEQRLRAGTTRYGVTTTLTEESIQMVFGWADSATGLAGRLSSAYQDMIPTLLRNRRKIAPALETLAGFVTVIEEALKPYQLAAVPTSLIQVLALLDELPSSATAATAQAELNKRLMGVVTAAASTDLTLLRENAPKLIQLAKERALALFSMDALLTLEEDDLVDAGAALMHLASILDLLEERVSLFRPLEGIFASAANLCRTTAEYATNPGRTGSLRDAVAPALGALTETIVNAYSRFGALLSSPSLGSQVAGHLGSIHAITARLTAKAKERVSASATANPSFMSGLSSIMDLFSSDASGSASAGEATAGGAAGSSDTQDAGDDADEEDDEDALNALFTTKLNRGNNG